MMLQKKNPNCPQIPDQPCRILIIGGSESRKTNSSFNLLSHRQNIDKIYLYNKNPYKVKYQLLINKRQNTSLKHLNDSKAFIEYLNNMDNIY